MSELTLKKEDTRRRLSSLYTKSHHIQSLLKHPSFDSQSDSEPATMTTPHLKPVEVLQWQRQASPPTSLRQPPKRACYNRHLLIRSTSQRACYKRLLKRAWAATFYIKRIRENTGWFRSRWVVYCSDEDIACWRRGMMLRLCCSKLLCCFAKQQFPDCCSFPLTAAAMAWR